MRKHTSREKEEKDFGKVKTGCLGALEVNHSISYQFPLAKVKASLSQVQHQFLYPRQKAGYWLLS